MAAALQASRPLTAPLRATDDLEMDEGDLWDDGDMTSADGGGGNPTSATTTGMLPSVNSPWTFRSDATMTPCTRSPTNAVLSPALQPHRR